MPPARIALWVASIGGVGLLLRTLFIGPVPWWVATLAFGGYATFAALGVILPQLEMYGDVVCRGDPGATGIALTFDDGPHPRTTRAILAILSRAGHKATFFVVGRKVEKYPDVVREIHEAGHWLGLHGYEHDRLFSFKPPKYVKADIVRTQDAIEEVCGVRPVLFRPPVGHVSSRTAVGARRAGVTLVAWSARGFDGTPGARPERVLDRIEPRLRNGAIVMLHDAAERDDFEPVAAEVLPQLLQAIDERGLRTVSVEELLDVEDEA